MYLVPVQILFDHNQAFTIATSVAKQQIRLKYKLKCTYVCMCVCACVRIDCYWHDLQSRDHLNSEFLIIVILEEGGAGGGGEIGGVPLYHCTIGVRRAIVKDFEVV